MCEILPFPYNTPFHANNECSGQLCGKETRRYIRARLSLCLGLVVAIEFGAIYGRDEIVVCGWDDDDLDDEQGGKRSTPPPQVVQPHY